jgi:uncharacterized protein
MHVILDTNILISAFFSKTGTPRLVLDFAKKYTKILISQETRQEVFEKIHRRKFDHYASAETKELFLDSLLKIAETVKITKTISNCQDKDDNKFLELAVCDKADFSVSTDKDLLTLNPFREIPIIRATKLLERVGTPPFTNILSP